MNKLTSEMESTHKIWLEHGRINRLRPLARQTSSSPYILPIFPKTGWAGFQSFLCISRVLALIKPRWGSFSAHSTHVQCLTAYRTSVRSPHRSRTQNCEKNAIRQERGQRTRTGEIRKLQLLQLRDIDGQFPGHSLGCFEVSKAQFNWHQGQEVLG
jgi:hypothetical protein